MSKKAERDYVKHIAKCGLKLVDASKTNGGRLRLMVLAPNGATRPFFFSDHSGEWRTLRNNLAEIDRFAAENPAPAVRRALTKALDNNIVDNVSGPSFVKALAAFGTAVDSASRTLVEIGPAPAVSFELQPYQREAMRAIEARVSIPSAKSFTAVYAEQLEARRLAKAAMLARDEPAAPTPSPASVSAPVSPPAAPAASIESKTMNTPTIKTTPVIQRLDRKQFHALTKWVATNVAQGREITLTSLAREATKALDFHIAESSLKDALDLEEIKLADPHSRKAGVHRDRAQIVAAELVRVMQSLGVEPSAELEAIAARRGQ